MKNKFKEYYKSNPDIGEEHDTIARDVCKKHLPLLYKQIISLEDHPNKYDIDLIANTTDNGDTLYVECEYSLSWKTGKFPFPILNVPSRKEKFFIKYDRSIYCLVNKDKTMMGIVKGEDILNSPLKETPNRFNKSGEYFFKVDLDKVIFKELK